MENISIKEAKRILSSCPHKWYYDKFGTDLICGVCGSNMEGMEYEAARTNIKYLSNGYQKVLFKKIKKYGPTPWDFDDNKNINVPKSVFRVIKTIEDPEDLTLEKVEYEYPEDTKIVKCSNCSELEKVYAHSEYRPLWIRLLEFTSNIKHNLKPYVIKNKICKRFGLCGWDKKTHTIMWPSVFASKYAETNYNSEHPKRSAEVLIYGYDRALAKNIFIIAYYRADTDKFYMAKDCLKENDIISYWKINIENWIVLKYITLDEFEDRG